MEKILRYKNGTLYSAQDKRFINTEGIVTRMPGLFYVIDASTKVDVTNEVAFLAQVAHIKKTGMYDRVIIVYRDEPSL